ncbi:MAG TPA: hypothetical protein H9795_07745 [Candidatus Fournierella merdigallinarum]|nr:hypothetical protein [Candidatus Fournierella merdigallinarum]
MTDYSAEISSLSEQISSCQSSLDKATKACESLEQFKRVIENAQSDFHNCMAQKNVALDLTERYSVNTESVKKYCDGMDSRLNGIGARGVEAAYLMFLVAINGKLVLYRTRISHYESLISSYNNAIDDLRSRQLAEEAQQEGGTYA